MDPAQRKVEPTRLKVLQGLKLRVCRVSGWVWVSRCRVEGLGFEGLGLFGLSAGQAASKINSFPDSMLRGPSHLVSRL